MGYSLSWIAVPAVARGQLLDAFKLSPTGRFDEEPDAEASGIDLPSGWYAVVRNRFDVTEGDLAGLARLSRKTRVIACGVEEHVMASWACEWSAGRKAWSVSHDAEAGLRNLAATGDTPPEYPAVRDRLLAEQDRSPEGPDYLFDVPVALAETLTGFRHDSTSPGRTDRPFEVLAPRKAGWRRWFG